MGGGGGGRRIGGGGGGGGSRGGGATRIVTPGVGVATGVAVGVPRLRRTSTTPPSSGKMPGSLMAPAQVEDPLVPAGEHVRLRVPCDTPSPFTTGMLTSGTSPGSSPIKTALTVKLPVFVVCTQLERPDGEQGPGSNGPEAHRKLTPLRLLAFGTTARLA